MRAVCCLMAILTMTGVARGQDASAKPDDLKKLYKDTLVLLQAAQERKTELATQNEKLAARVAELEKKVQDQTAELNDLKRQAAAFSDRTFFLRSYYTAWERFVELHPAVKTQWSFFLANLAPLSVPGSTPFLDSDWPLSADQ